jgi:D-3-phosphoglycerate dehydrogenase/(S)-sulfolactate dehydrogenase
VNIARIYLSRDDRRAVSLVNVDSAPTVELLEELRRLPHVRSVRAIRL